MLTRGALPSVVVSKTCNVSCVPVRRGSSVELELRMLPLLPQLSYMVSAPRQPVNTGNALLTRFDANKTLFIERLAIRLWRIYQGVCRLGGQTKRMYSHVVRPRTATRSMLVLLLDGRNAKLEEANWPDPSRSTIGLQHEVAVASHS